MTIVTDTRARVKRRVPPNAIRRGARTPLLYSLVVGCPVHSASYLLRLTESAAASRRRSDRRGRRRCQLISSAAAREEFDAPDDFLYRRARA